MTSIHGLQHVERLGPTYLANDDAIGAHTQAVSNEVSLRDLAFPLHVDLPRFKSNDVRLT